MHISGFMCPVDKVISCRPDHSIRTALDLMTSKKIGCVVVLDPEKKNRPLGLVTKTVMLEAFQKGMNPDVNTVADIMETSMTAVLETMYRDDAAKVFEREKKHHAIVIDKDQNWKGVISSWDIAVECAKDARAWPWNRTDNNKLTSEAMTPSSPRSPVEAEPRERRSSFAQYIDNLQYLDI